MKWLYITDDLKFLICLFHIGIHWNGKIITFAFHFFHFKTIWKCYFSLFKSESKSGKVTFSLFKSESKSGKVTFSLFKSDR